MNRLYLDPVLRGTYPEDVVAATTGLTDWSFVQPGDASVIAAPIDVLGINYYAPHRAQSTPRRAGWSDFPQNLGIEMLPPRGEVTDMGWEISPKDLTDLLVRLAREYGVPLMVTENGAAFPDVLQETGRVEDPRRVAYLEGHLRAVHDAISAGADVRAYFAWSLLDNFEWAEGYSKRFGLVHVDYETLERHPKDSALWFAEGARRNRIP